MKNKEAAEALKTFSKHVSNAGRDEYGWNRTKKGEPVTENKVFLGNIYGLFTHPVSKWKEYKSESKGKWDGSGDVQSVPAYDIVDRQARNFMKSHLDEMIKNGNVVTSVK